MMRIRLLGRRVWFNWLKILASARRGWWWTAAAFPVLGTFMILVIAVLRLPPEVSAVVLVGICFAAWSTGCVVFGLAAGAALTWQRQQEIQPAVPAVQPQPPDRGELPDIQSPDFYSRLAEQFAAGEEDDTAPPADEEGQVPPPAAIY